MANGQEVGKISIRVVPDLKKFYGELKRGLEAAEKGNKVEVDVEADLKKFRSEVAAATKKLPDAEIDVNANTKNLRQQLARAADGADVIDLNVNSRGIRRQLDLINLAFERRADQTLGKRRLDVQAPYELERRLNTMDLNWDRKVRKFLEQTTHQIKLEPDLDFDYRIRKRLAKFKPEPLKIELDVDQAATYRLRQRVAKIKPKVKVDLDVDRGALRRMRDSFGNFMGKIEAPNFGTGINPTGYAVILAAILAVAGPLVGLLTTALLALPGLVAAVAAPIGAVMLGLDGLKKAAERLKKPFEDLKKHMSIEVERQFAPVFDQVKSLFPVMEQALPPITQGVADMAQGVADALISSEGSIRNTATNIAKALSDSAPGVRDFTTAILGLVEGFSEEFPGLTEWFNNTAADFKDWVAEIRANGDLSTWFEGLGSTLKTIADSLGQIAQAGLDFMSDPENIRKLAEGLKDLADALTVIVGLSDKLYEFSDFFKTFNVPHQLMKGFSGGFQELAAPLVSEFTIAFGQIVNAAAVAAQRVVSVFQSIQSTLSGVWNGVVGSAQTAFSTLAGAARTALAEVVASFVTGGAQIVAEVTTWPGKIATAIGDLSGTLVAAGRSLLAGLKQGMMDGLADVLVFAGNIAAKIAAVKGPLDYDRKVLIPNGGALMEGLETGLTSGFENVLELAKDIAGRISEAFEEGVDLSNMLGGEKLPDLQKTLDAIEQEKKRLKVEKNAATDKEKKKALQNQIDQLQAQKDQLSYQKDLIKNEQKYGEQVSRTGDSWQENLRKFVGIPKDFVDANAGQLISDLGGTGSGMIPELIRQGVGIGEQFIFNVSSMDEALAGKQNITNKKALQYKSR